MEGHIRFENVQKSYDGENLVVKNLNLEIEGGEFLTLLGPSGSGKTTCLMMLAGFETATHGEIYIDEQPINRIPPHQRGIGMVFQNYALFPHMTVAENLAFPLKVRRRAPAEVARLVGKALEMVHLGEFGGRAINQLSGGQQQRVAVARALVFEPKLVLMDEPLGALDKNLREKMQYELKHIHEALGVTFVYVTHDQGEALTMSNRIAIFNDGVIQQLSTPDDLYEQPQNSFVAQFIGENNKIRGRVLRAADGACEVEVAPGEAPVVARAVAVGAGDATSLSLRPERVALSPDAALGLDNVFDAVVQETIYHGDHLRIRFALFGADEFIIKVPNADLRGDTLSVGQKVTVGWRSKDCHALDA